MRTAALLRGAGPGTGAAVGGVRKGETVTVIVRAVQDPGLDVQVGDDGPVGFVKRGDLGRDRDEQRPERFQVGQHFDAMVIGFDRSKKPNFSIKAMQIAEEKQAVAQYGSSDSGASLGDILGAGAEGSPGNQVQEEDNGERRRFFDGTPPELSRLRETLFPDSVTPKRPPGGEFGASEILCVMAAPVPTYPWPLRHSWSRARSMLAPLTTTATRRPSSARRLAATAATPAMPAPSAMR